MKGALSKGFTKTVHLAVVYIIPRLHLCYVLGTKFEILPIIHAKEEAYKKNPDTYSNSCTYLYEFIFNGFVTCFTSRAPI